MKLQALCTALILAASTLTACERGARTDTPGATGPSAASPPTTPAELQSGPVRVTGTNYCLGCSLKKKEGAAADSKTYGHRHALEVERAETSNGQLLPSLHGRTLHYLDNRGSEPLLKGDELHGKRVEVSGKLYAVERMLEINDIKAL